MTTDTSTVTITAMMDGMLIGRAVQFHPIYCPEAKDAAFKDWDTSHDVSIIRPDGSRYRIAEFRHSAEATFYCFARDLIPTLTAERDNALESIRELEAELACLRGLIDNEGSYAAGWVAGMNEMSDATRKMIAEMTAVDTKRADAAEAKADAAKSKLEKGHE